MANDFSADANCKALCRLEAGALTADSKGGNTLANSSVAEDAADYKEGACSGLFSRAFAARMLIADADTDADFPLRSDAATTSFSFAVWIKLTAVNLTQYILCKTGSAPARQMVLYVDSANKVTLSVSADGTNFTSYAHASSLAADTWYHIAVTHNDADHAYRIRIWDDTAGAILGVDKTGTSVHPYLAAGGFYLGYPSSSLTIGGNEDEVVALNDVLSVSEIDEIRAGTYSGGAPSQTVLDYERKTRGVARGVCRGAA